jgi:hypothetical protein
MRLGSDLVCYRIPDGSLLGLPPSSVDTPGMKWWTFVLLPFVCFQVVACSDKVVPTPSRSPVTTSGFQSRVPEHVERAIASYASGRVEIVGSFRAGPSEAALFWAPAEQTGWLALIEESDGSWGVTETEPLLLPQPEDRWGGFSSHLQIAVPHGRFIGGWVDPEADAVATADVFGEEFARTVPEEGGYILFDSDAQAVQVRTFRADSLLSAAYLEPDVELDLVPDNVPEASWNAEFVRSVLATPEGAERFVPEELLPSLLVGSLAGLLKGTPSVASATRSVVHLSGPDQAAVLFLIAYVIDGEPLVVGYDYRIR